VSFSQYVDPKILFLIALWSLREGSMKRILLLLLLLLLLLPLPVQYWHISVKQIPPVMRGGAQVGGGGGG